MEQNIFTSELSEGMSGLGANILGSEEGVSVPDALIVVAQNQGRP